MFGWGESEGSVRFTWLVRRRETGRRESAFIASALTAASVVGISLPLVHAYRAEQSPSTRSPGDPGEVVAFVAPVPRTTARGQTPSDTTTRRRSVVRQTPLPSVEGSPSAPLQYDSIAAGRVDQSVRRDSVLVAAPAARVVGPVMSRSGVSRSLVPTAPIPLPWTRELTQEEIDVAYREEDRRLAADRADHRPSAMPLGGIGVPLPIFSRGPSPKQRLQDSIVNAENLPRLARLAERARAKRDSLRHADSLALLAKAIRMTGRSDPRR
jgi:hypothetical protein